MCGIIGYIGEKEAAPILLKGLKRLEYRGYDSAGICVSNKELTICKKKGRVSELDAEIQNLHGKIGIGHTRWATHGEPSEKNSHPHTDCSKNIAIVHNGIVENFESLKKILESEGHKIISETDSEIIAHLIEKFYSGDLEEAVVKSLKLIEGTFGIAVIHKDEEKIILAKRGSPLVIGIREKEIFAASDVPAILEYTNKIIYMNDNEIAILEKNNFHIKNFSGDFLDKKIEEIKWTIDQLEKGDFKHFMLKEIFEQPSAIQNTLRGRIKEKIKLSLRIDPRKIKKIIIVACGTSWHSALIGKFLIEKFAEIPVEVDYASEFRYRNPLITKDDLVIGISQSGETADTLGAIQEAKSKNAKTLGIINVVGSTISRVVDSGIYIHAGPEIGVASTKAFTSQVTALFLFALYLKQEKGAIIENGILNELEKIPEKIKNILDDKDKIKKIAENFVSSRNFLYFGRGINFPVALEGALKLKEISYIHAEGYPSAEMKHGPIALVDEEMPVVFIATNNSLIQKTLSNMQEIKSRGGKIISIVNETNSEIIKLSDYIIEIPKTIEELSPILNTIPLQLLAYYIAGIRGIDVDKPRNLAKSVTVE
ncbi:glutamine--fructose-6-phosphate transaminase (isomerizing) [Candidatus Pacearchaeota archaeon]|jgi:glucosamine--fructose-6-phosphate aminotransferase (isomerizing)|nr:glutamine--fructose-6-phosphate transaminase (isomerizing) [Candidatus Pacearchaeota archaeon]